MHSRCTDMIYCLSNSGNSDGLNWCSSLQGQSPIAGLSF